MLLRGVQLASFITLLLSGYVIYQNISSSLLQVSFTGAAIGSQSGSSYGVLLFMFSLLTLFFTTILLHEK